MSVPGIGPLISTAVVAAIGTGEAFERGRDFSAWLGLVPRQYSTGGRSILGRISKRRSKSLSWDLAASQSAQVARNLLCLSLRGERDPLNLELGAASRLIC